MGNIIGIFTKRHNNPRLPQRYRRQIQRSHINDDVPLIPIRATLYDNFDPDVKELLLEKDRETRRVEQNRDFTVQQYQKRLKVLEMRIDDLENENALLESFVQKLRELPVLKMKKT